MGGKIDIQITHRKKVLRLRRLDRLIQSEEFEHVWCRIGEEEKKIALRMIQSGQYNTFKHWLEAQFDLGFKMYSIRDLRTLASRYHVRYYSRKTRAELIKALTEKGVLDGNTGGPLGQDETTSSHCGCKKMSSGSLDQETTLKIGSYRF